MQERRRDRWMTEAALFDEPGFLIARLAIQLNRSANAALAELDLRIRPYSVLALVCDEGDGVTQRRVSTVLDLDPSQIVPIVDDLEGAGWLRRTQDAADRRNRLLVPTAEGREVRERARLLVDQAHAVPLAELRSTEGKRLVALLRHLVLTDGGTVRGG
ncbi:MarR family transcriptional regulator [Enemella evansiae]|nr:MarR family transcriptional regulator [Enemella evansiae]OYO14189.1 MarR family transcriptional regulator [Enemella evansiae]